MSENLHQSLSAIMDAADDDLELPRLLSALAASPEQEKALGEKWRRYHLAQGILRGDLRGQASLQLARTDLSSRVMQQLESEAAVEKTVIEKTVEAGTKAEPAARAVSERHQWFRGGALAASVALLVITGVQIFNAGKEAVHPSGSPSIVTRQPSPQQQEQQQATAAPLVSSAGIKPVSSPFEPHAFTGRSLVSFATGEQPVASSTARAQDSFSILATPTPAPETAIPAR